MAPYPVDTSSSPQATVDVQTSCPACGAPRMLRTARCDDEHWLCPSCGRCWTPRERAWRAADPVTCPGCATRSRHACIEQFRGAFPRFGMPMFD